MSVFLKSPQTGRHPELLIRELYDVWALFWNTPEKPFEEIMKARKAKPGTVKAPWGVRKIAYTILFLWGSCRSSQGREGRRNRTTSGSNNSVASMRENHFLTVLEVEIQGQVAILRPLSTARRRPPPLFLSPWSLPWVRLLLSYKHAGLLT